MISISQRQRRPLAHANWVGNIHHGLPLDLYLPLPTGSEGAENPISPFSAGCRATSAPTAPSRSPAAAG